MEQAEIYTAMKRISLSSLIALELKRVTGYEGPMINMKRHCMKNCLLIGVKERPKNLTINLIKYSKAELEKML